MKKDICCYILYIATRNPKGVPILKGPVTNRGSRPQFRLSRSRWACCTPSVLTIYTASVMMRQTSPWFPMSLMQSSLETGCDTHTLIKLMSLSCLCIGVYQVDLQCKVQMEHWDGTVLYVWQRQDQSTQHFAVKELPRLPVCAGWGGCHKLMALPSTLTNLLHHVWAHLETDVVESGRPPSSTWQVAWCQVVWMGDPA